MKVIIQEHERGFLFKDGKFLRMLEPGKHKFTPFLLNKRVLKVEARGEVELEDIEIKPLLKDEHFAKSIIKVTVPDNHLVIRYEDGRFAEVILQGEHYYWNIFRQNSFDIVNVESPEILESHLKLVTLMPKCFYKRFEISDGEVGLLFFDGKFQRILDSGLHCFWDGPIKVTCQTIDLRKQQLDVSGQEILTADKVSLRLNFMCSYRIADPVGLVKNLKDYKNQIYTVTQLILREFIGKYRFDELLEQKEQIAGFVLEKLQAKQEELYIQFLDAGLKDIILPGEIRDIMNTVLIAEKNAQANVISRREEVASTRSLLNTAKLMEENKTLYKLKELEYLERICDRVGNISVGNGNLLGQLNEILQPK